MEEAVGAVVAAAVSSNPPRTSDFSRFRAPGIAVGVAASSR